MLMDIVEDNGEMRYALPLHLLAPSCAPLHHPLHSPYTLLCTPSHPPMEIVEHNGEMG